MSFDKCLLFCDLDFWTHALQNLISSWSDYRKCLYKVWLKSLYWFSSCRSYCVHSASQCVSIFQITQTRKLCATSPPRYGPYKHTTGPNFRERKKATKYRVSLMCAKTISGDLSVPSSESSVCINLRPISPTTINYKSDCRSYSGFLCSCCNRLVCFCRRAQWLIVLAAFLLFSVWANTSLINSKYLRGQSHSRCHSVWPSAQARRGRPIVKHAWRTWAWS